MKDKNRKRTKINDNDVLGLSSLKPGESKDFIDYGGWPWMGFRIKKDENGKVLLCLLRRKD